jgi:hypothetical protein
MRCITKRRGTAKVHRLKSVLSFLVMGGFFSSTFDRFRGDLPMLSVFRNLFSGELFNAYQFVLGGGSPYELI